MNRILLKVLKERKLSLLKLSKTLKVGCFRIKKWLKSIERNEMDLKSLIEKSKVRRKKFQ
jgi:hypothetical protein